MSNISKTISKVLYKIYYYVFAGWLIDLICKGLSKLSNWIRMILDKKKLDLVQIESWEVDLDPDEREQIKASTKKIVHLFTTWKINLGKLHAWTESIRIKDDIIEWYSKKTKSKQKKSFSSEDNASEEKMRKIMDVFCGLQSDSSSTDKLTKSNSDINLLKFVNLSTLISSIMIDSSIEKTAKEKNRANLYNYLRKFYFCKFPLPFLDFLINCFKNHDTNSIYDGNVAYLFLIKFLALRIDRKNDFVVVLKNLFAENKEADVQRIANLPSTILNRKRSGSCINFTTPSKYESEKPKTKPSVQKQKSVPNLKLVSLFAMETENGKETPNRKKEENVIVKTEAKDDSTIFEHRILQG